MLSLLYYLRSSHKKWKLSCHLWHCFQMIAICSSLSVTCYMLLAIWIFLSETSYYLQKLVLFARCCTSRNFFFVWFKARINDTWTPVEVDTAYVNVCEEFNFTKSTVFFYWRCAAHPWCLNAMNQTFRK